MNEIKHLACPNCGANTSDFKNCEYCGSLLVRFVEKGIDLSQTTYLNNNETYPGLINALKLNLQLQESAKEEIVATDIVGPPVFNRNDIKRDYLSCVLRNGYMNYRDGTPIPSKSNTGLGVGFIFPFYIDKGNGHEEFNAAVEELHKRFKALDCYTLFNERICFFTDEEGNKKGYEYNIDFGKDAEGAARLISKVLKEVYQIPFDANI